MVKENISNIVQYKQTWKDKVCIFGAGKNGKECVYEWITYLLDMSVDFYCDNYKSGEMLNGLPVYSLDYIEANFKQVLYIISVAGEKGEEIRTQLKERGCENVIVLNKLSLIDELEQYLMKECDTEVQQLFKNLTDDAIYLEYLFKLVMGKKLDINNPKTFNEKLQWIKLNDRLPVYPVWADKYAVRAYVKEKFGEKYLIPLVMKTNDVRDLKAENMPDYPVIIKTNAGCHDYTIIRDKNKVDWEAIQEKYSEFLKHNLYYSTREWHYKDIKPCIVVEKLLMTREGKIPNDYKLQFFNGELQFVYCTIDREGKNYRKIYNPEWKFMEFIMGEGNDIDYENPDINAPETFEEMIRIGKEVSRGKHYVRMDYYEVEGELYFGEITLCHGAGFDKFNPECYDLYWGERLKLNDEDSII